MAKSTKSYEERMLEMEKKEQESLEKAKRYAVQKKELLKRKKAEESKKRTHRLCQVGGAVESVLGAPIEEEDIPKLIGFLKKPVSYTHLDVYKRQAGDGLFILELYVILVGTIDPFK